MSDFSTLLREYVSEQTERAQAATLDPKGSSLVVAWQARRRRAARAGLVVGAAAAVVLVVAAGVFAGTRPDAVPPAETHEPSVTPTPSEGPAEPEAVEPQPDPGTAVGTLQPESQPLAPGMLAAAVPGSFLVDYTVGCGYPCLEPTSDPVVYLVAPDGGVYASTAPHPEGMVRDWLPGTSVVLFARAIGYEGEVVVAVDLDSGRTLGEVIVADGLGVLADTGHVLRRTWDWSGDVGVMHVERVALADGTVVADVELPASSAEEISPDHTRLLVTSSSGVRVLDTTSLAEVPMPHVEGAFGQPCEGIGWVGTDVVVGCPDTGGTRVRRVPLDGGSVTEVGLHPYGYPYQLTDVWSIGDRLVLTPGAGSGDWWLPEDMAGAPEDLRFVVSRGGGLFRNVFIDWNATGWSRDYAVSFQGATPTGVLAATSPAGSDGQSLVLIDPITGSAETVLAPPVPGWGRVEGVVVRSSEGGQ